MKKFKILLVGTSVKEVFLNAKNEESALDKAQKMLFDTEKINFEFEDLKDLKWYSSEIKSIRREQFFNPPTNIPSDIKDVLINCLLDTFDKSEKKATKDGLLTIKVTKEDVRNITKMYEEYKRLCD